MEFNTTGNLLYQTRDFSIDRATGNWDVEDFEDRKKMKPWEVRNADGADERRQHVLTWLKAASGWQERMVNDGSLPLTPKWQSRKR